MVESGASSEEIREEVFEEFESNLQTTGIDDDVAEQILDIVCSENPPNEFSDELMQFAMNDEA